MMSKIWRNSTNWLIPRLFYRILTTVALVLWHSLGTFKPNIVPYVLKRNGLLLQLFLLKEILQTFQLETTVGMILEVKILTMDNVVVDASRMMLNNDVSVADALAAVDLIFFVIVLILRTAMEISTMAILVKVVPVP